MQEIAAYYSSDLQSSWWNYHRFTKLLSTEGPALASVNFFLQAIDILPSSIQDRWYKLCLLMIDVWSRPTPNSVALIEGYLDRGLNPNLQFHYKGYNRSLLDCALQKLRLAMEKTKLQSVASNREIGTLSTHGLTEGTMHNEREVPAWCIVSALIKGGADIYHIDAEDFDDAATWKDLYTPWDWAAMNDVEDEWFAALRDSGLDPDRVRDEDIQRCKQAFRLYGATRTGVDERTLDLPPVSGLRYRPCRQQHGQRLFDDW